VMLPRVGSEHPAVNRSVLGSNPSPGATLLRPIPRLLQPVIDPQDEQFAPRRRQHLTGNVKCGEGLLVVEQAAHARLSLGYLRGHGGEHD